MDLFDAYTSLRAIPISNGNVSFLAKLTLPHPSAALLAKLIAETPWRTDPIKVWGKVYMQPRLMAWYGDMGKSYMYSGRLYEPYPWTPLLLQLKDGVEQACDHTFNSVLLNYYRDGNDSMGFHSDNEVELGKNPVIASLSLGETRTFILKHKTNKSLKPIRLKLNDASLLLMAGELQTHWQHGIPKENKSCSARINLTFRTVF
jgi:alkylated DNA repair dioxygenase AlkB